eukprot:9058829-Alexandrium_andersonii.AAC.1
MLISASVCAMLRDVAQPAHTPWETFQDCRSLGQLSSPGDLELMGRGASPAMMYADSQNDTTIPVNQEGEREGDSERERETER